MNTLFKLLLLPFKFMFAIIYYPFYFMLKLMFLIIYYPICWTFKIAFFPFSIFKLLFNNTNYNAILNREFYAENLDENKEKLSYNGVYLITIKSRNATYKYIGSTYNDGTLYRRWKKHLSVHGDAELLNKIWEREISNNKSTKISFTPLYITKNKTNQSTMVEMENKFKLQYNTRNNGNEYGLNLN